MPNAEDLPARNPALAESDTPLDEAELDRIMAPLGDVPQLLLAVSGGADSLALMVLCHEWQCRGRHPVSLHVASVDHGFRPEARQECDYVASLAEERGLPHTTLLLRDHAISSNLQAEARKARYGLLADHARELGCGHIAVAHHMDDQAETLVMRLLRGSGLTGLGAMRPSQAMGEVTLLRPLLSVPKARLVASLKARGIEWVEDPSNRSDAYQRVRVRGLLPVLAREGGDAERLAATARRLQRADAALEDLAYELFLRHMRTEPGRALSFVPSDFAIQSEELRLRLLRLALHTVAGPAYPPREEKLMALDAALCEIARCAQDEAGDPRAKRTMGGCCFELFQERLWVYREPGRVAPTVVLEGGKRTDWLGLYRVMIAAGDGGLDREGLHMRPLGPDGRQYLLDNGMRADAPQSGISRDGEGRLPVGLVEALPSIWRNNLPVLVVDWDKACDSSGCPLEIEEICTKFLFNRPRN